MRNGPEAGPNCTEGTPSVFPKSVSIEDCLSQYVQIHARHSVKLAHALLCGEPCSHPAVSYGELVNPHLLCRGWKDACYKRCMLTPQPMHVQAPDHGPHNHHNPGDSWTAAAAWGCQGAGRHHSVRHNCAWTGAAHLCSHVHRWLSPSHLPHPLLVVRAAFR